MWKFYLTHRKDYQVLPLKAREDLEAIAMKGYSTFPKTSPSSDNFVAYLKYLDF